MALQFSNEQWDNFDERAERHFAERLAAHLRETQSIWVEGWEEEEMQQRVASGIARARSHGLTWESSIAGFVTLMVRFAPDFDRLPPVRALLARQDVPSESRVDLLFTDIPAALWQLAEDRYDPAGWDEFPVSAD